LIRIYESDTRPVRSFIIAVNPISQSVVLTGRQTVLCVKGVRICQTNRRLIIHQIRALPEASFDQRSRNGGANGHGASGAVSLRIEHALSKHEILEVYLNIAEWGLHIQGIEAAARYYFDKSAASLNWEESALLAGILQNPVLFNPRTYPKRAREKQVQVLDKLLRFGKLSPMEHAAALRKYIRLNPDPLLLQGAHSRQLQDGSGKSRPQQRHTS